MSVFNSDQRQAVRQWFANLRQGKVDVDDFPEEFLQLPEDVQTALRRSGRGQQSSRQSWVEPENPSQHQD